MTEKKTFKELMKKRVSEWNIVADTSKEFQLKIRLLILKKDLVYFLTKLGKSRRFPIILEEKGAFCKISVEVGKSRK